LFITPIYEPIEINANSQELVRGFAEFKPNELQIDNEVNMRVQAVLKSLGINITKAEIKNITQKSENLKEKRGKPVKFGGWEGKIVMPDDFNAPLDDFEEYM